MQRKNEILFYRTGDEYDIFSNVTDVGFTMNVGGSWYKPRSSEAIYQGLKFYSSGDVASAKDMFNDQRPPGAHIQKKGNAVQNKLFQTSNASVNNQFLPYDSKKYTSFKAPRNIDIKEQVMYETLLAKFTQNPNLMKALLDTGDATLTENTKLASYDDSFWGNGLNGNGRNALGIALMRVREDARKELKATGQIEVRTGFSNQLADSLKIPHSAPPSQPVYITQKQLQRTPPATTVGALNRLKQIGQARSFQPPKAKPTSQYEPPKTRNRQTPPSSPYERRERSKASPKADSQILAEGIVEKLRGDRAIGLEVAPDRDPSKPGQFVLKIKFANPDAAKEFKNFARANYMEGEDTVVLGPLTSKNLFEKLGRQDPTFKGPVFNVLVDLHKKDEQQKSAERERVVTTQDQQMGHNYLDDETAGMRYQNLDRGSFVQSLARAGYDTVDLNDQLDEINRQIYLLEANKNNPEFPKMKTIERIAVLEKEFMKQTEWYRESGQHYKMQTDILESKMDQLEKSNPAFKQMMDIHKKETGLENTMRKLQTLTHKRRELENNGASKADFLKVDEELNKVHQSVQEKFGKFLDEVAKTTKTLPSDQSKLKIKMSEVILLEREAIENAKLMADLRASSQFKILKRSNQSSPDDLLAAEASLRQATIDFYNASIKTLEAKREKYKAQLESPDELKEKGLEKDELLGYIKGIDEAIKSTREDIRNVEVKLKEVEGKQERIKEQKGPEKETPRPGIRL